MTRGLFLTLEGLDGAGKGTHLRWMVEQLQAVGVSVLVTREPGGTALGEALRALLLSEDMAARTEALLMYAARNEHWRTRIEPALQAGQWVLCDRFNDASFAYQGGGRGLGAAAIQVLDDWVLQGQQPDGTVFFDVAPSVARRRRDEAGRRQDDRFEAQDTAFFERTRAAYLARQHGDPLRVRRVDAGASIEQTRERLRALLDEWLARWRAAGGTPGGRP